MVDCMGRTRHVSIDMDAAHQKAGTHPGKGWSWHTNTKEPKKYRRRDGYRVVNKAFNSDGKVWKDASAVFESAAHRAGRLGK